MTMMRKISKTVIDSREPAFCRIVGWPIRDYIFYGGWLRYKSVLAIILYKALDGMIIDRL